MHHIEFLQELLLFLARFWILFGLSFYKLCIRLIPLSELFFCKNFIAADSEEILQTARILIGSCLTNWKSAQILKAAGGTHDRSIYQIGMLWLPRASFLKLGIAGLSLSDAVCVLWGWWGPTEANERKQSRLLPNGQCLLRAVGCDVAKLKADAMGTVGADRTAACPHGLQLQRHVQAVDHSL